MAQLASQKQVGAGIRVLMLNACRVCTLPGDTSTMDGELDAVCGEVCSNVRPYLADLGGSAELVLWAHALQQGAVDGVAAGPAGGEPRQIVNAAPFMARQRLCVAS